MPTYDDFDGVVTPRLTAAAELKAYLYSILMIIAVRYSAAHRRGRIEGTSYGRMLPQVPALLRGSPPRPN